MQSINRAILNPVFFICFFGTVVLLPLNAYLQYNGKLTINFTLYSLSAAFYVIGLFGITVLGNVPLNDTLNAFDLGNASQEAVSGMRETFEGPWNKWHSVRTAAVFVSLLLLSIASVLPKR
ncbi:anthrone oxygenase family protein [Flavobacterium beibuense]|uniref:anthrone oxygenase family protein n=1 Tax=Flavobacterium beibuense TaxID=657326 RepID=UPI00068EBDD6|nr:anthrone oxygenase family protein [Flavobacterium beibuense]